MKTWSEISDHQDPNLDHLLSILGPSFTCRSNSDAKLEWGVYTVRDGYFATLSYHCLNYGHVPAKCPAKDNGPFVRNMQVITWQVAVHKVWRNALTVWELEKRMLTILQMRCVVWYWMQKYTK